MDDSDIQLLARLKVKAESGALADSVKAALLRIAASPTAVGQDDAALRKVICDSLR